MQLVKPGSRNSTNYIKGQNQSNFHFLVKVETVFKKIENRK